jgi:sulfite exporter TauE/SafE
MTIGTVFYLLLQGVFLGYGPCLLTCAPIILPYAATKRSWSEGLAATLSFSLARLLVYMVLGGIFGYFGAYILKFYYSSNIGYYIKAIISTVVIMIGIGVFLGKDLNFKFCRMGEGNMVLLGILVGLSPCLPLIGILLEIALLSKGFVSGLVYSFFFGIGTVISPLLLIGSLAPAIGSRLDQKLSRIFNYICGVLIVMVGGYLLIK